MRASELLGRLVLDANGTAIGVVHDVRISLPGDIADAGSAVDQPQTGNILSPTLVTLVVGPDDFRCRLAHAWGYAQGGSRGLALLSALLARQASRTPCCRSR